MIESPQTTTAFNVAISKSNRFKTQLKTIFDFLQSQIATASMVSKSTGIPQKNITRYKRDLEKAGLLWEVDKKACKATGFKAYYLTTNPKIVVTSQLRLFCDGWE